MNDLPRQKLREIVARHGRSVIEDPRRCEGLLRDYCGEYRREVSVLVMTLEERAAADLLAAPAGTPREVLMARLARRLCDNLALSERAATWAVDSWALALGVISNDELQAFEQRRSHQTETVTAPVPTKSRAQQTSTASGISIIVSAKGDGEYTSLREALENAAPGARLIVRPGIYNEGVIVDKRIEIIGDGPVEDIIISSVDSSCIQMRADYAVVRDVTLRGRARGNTSFFAVDIPQGKLLLDQCDITSDTLSCVAVHGATADPLIRRCRIHDGADSGVYFFDDAVGTLEECEIFCNANVGVAITERANPIVRRSRIYDGNNAGVVVWKDGRGLIEACEVYGNRLAGIGISEGGNLTVRTCRIYEGENSGVFVHHSGEGTLENCDIFKHREAEVAITTRGNLSMRGCKIHHGQNSGVFVYEEGRVLLQDCAVNGNADTGVLIGTGALAAVRGCHIKGNGQVAIKVSEGGAASVEDSDLTDNLLGPWDVEDGAFIEHARNREQ